MNEGGYRGGQPADTVGPPARTRTPVDPEPRTPVDRGPLVTVVHVYLVTGRTVRWRLSAPIRFLDVVRRLDEGIEENDVTGLYMVDAATGHPRYIRTAHIVDISPEVE